MTKLSWYQEGLRFECTGCGKCCTGASGYVWVSEEEMQAMAHTLNISLDLFKRKYTRLSNNRYALTERKQQDGNYDCVFLKNKQCEVYQSRPHQCRTYPFWKENLNSEESWQLAAKECEGIQDKASVISYSEIEQKLL